MLKFEIITIFPKIFNSYFNTSIIARAQKKKLIQVAVHNLRDFAKDKYKTVDDKVYGGGPGMVLKLEPLVGAIDSVLKHQSKNERIKIILFSPAGKQFSSKIAKNYAQKYSCIIMICGHYEGIDARLKKILKEKKLKVEELSIGPYVLTGGELPAMVVVDAISRFIPKVLGKKESLEEKRYGVGLPVYTRPKIFVYKGKKYKVPKVLLSGNHKRIDEWRKKYATMSKI